MFDGPERAQRAKKSETDMKIVNWSRKEQIQMKGGQESTSDDTDDRIWCFGKRKFRNFFCNFFRTSNGNSVTFSVSLNVIRKEISRASMWCHEQKFVSPLRYIVILEWIFQVFFSTLSETRRSERRSQLIH